MIGEMWQLFRNLWNTGNSAIRMAFIFILIGMLVIIFAGSLGAGKLAAVVAITAVVGGACLVVAIVDPAIIAIINSSPGKVAIKAIVTGLAVEAAAGAYFWVVPTRNNPGMVLGLVVVSLAYFLMKQADILPKKLEKLIIVIIAMITFAFFLPKAFTALEGNQGVGIGALDSKAEALVQGKGCQQPAPVAKIEPVVVDAGKDKPLVYVADGTYHTFQANHPWILIYDGTKEKRMEAGPSWWKGAGSGGYIGAKGIKDGTVIEIERRQG